MPLGRRRAARKEGWRRERLDGAGGYVDDQSGAGLVLKGDELAVGRPGGHDLRGFAGGDLLVGAGVRAGDVVEIDVLDAVAVGDIGESFAVGRPGGALLVEGVVGEGDGRAADGHEVELVEGDEGDLFAVGRERRCVDAFDLMRGRWSRSRRPCARIAGGWI